MLAIERRMGRDAPVLGITFLSLSGIAGIVSTVHAIPQVNGWIIGLATLALEIGALIGIVKLYRRLLGKAGSVFRRRLATRRGWRYEPEATVPVPGPRSAPRFRSVPNGATSTTGKDVVYATANGLNVTVFDRSRAGERKMQTVWLVHLPMSLPFVLSSYLRYLQVEDGTLPAPANNLLAVLDSTGTSGSGYGAEIDRALQMPAIQMGRPGDHTDNPDFGRVLLNPDVRRAATAELPLRWWTEGTYLCATKDGDEPRGAKGDQVEEYVDRLTWFAAHFPWPAMAPYATR
jgi:hypothetical protein